jgi:hypothetical protein
MVLKLASKEDLEGLHSGQFVESSGLEYKASASIENTDGRKSEITKDVSAMANANGGQIVYGMTEKEHLPTGLDDGVPPKPFDGLWFEQVIQQNIRPPIEGIKITPIPAGNGNNYWVLNIPASKTVHQARDGRYYRRRNFRIDMLEDYEIREGMNRATIPEPFVEIFLPAEPTKIEWPADLGGPSGPIAITARIGNRSPALALYTHVMLVLSGELILVKHGGQETIRGRIPEGEVHTIMFNLVTPNHFPLIKEKVFKLGSGTHFAIPRAHRDEEKWYPIGYEISTSGYTCTRFGHIIKRGDELELRWMMQ